MIYLLEFLLEFLLERDLLRLPGLPGLPLSESVDMAVTDQSLSGDCGCVGRFSARPVRSLKTTTYPGEPAGLGTLELLEDGV